MKKIVISFLLLVTVLLGSCVNTPQEPPIAETQGTEEATEPVTEDPADPFASVRTSGEEWLIRGLAAHESGKQVENLKEFFYNRANMTYLTLYDHFFTYDKEKTVPVAEALFAFIYSEYGIEALTDLDRRCEYKTAYLKSLGLDMEYVQPKEIESFLASMDFSSNQTYQYIISFENVTYYFKDFSAGTPAQYHGFLYHNTTGLFEMIEYLKAQGFDEGLDTERAFHYYMTFDGSGFSKTVYATGNMYINDSYSALHEAVHAMGITQNDNIWLSEGLCNYFGNSLGFNEQIAASYIQILTMAKNGYFDAQASAGNKQYLLYKKVYEDYTARGGSLDLAATFDLRLYTDVSAKAELELNAYKTLGDAYQIANNKVCNSIGAELSYEQATSLVAYLADTYGMEKVLEAYQTQNPESVFGKGYEGLKAEWLLYLNA